MVARGATQSCHDFGERVLEGNLVGADEFLDLIAVQEEVELGDACNPKGKGRISVHLGLHSAEDDLLIGVGLRSCLVYRLEPHARRARWRPEIHDHTSRVLNDSLQLCKRSNVANLSDTGSSRRLGLLRTRSRHATHAGHSSTAHHLL